MKSSMFALLLCLAAAPPASAAAAGAKGKENPLGEVIVLLDSLAAKVTADGEAEAKAYKEYFEWCDDASKTKGFEIKTASSTKESLEATIAKEAAIVSGATLKIEELAAAIAADEAELKQATEIREKEAADFKSEEAELVDVVGTLERAIAIVEKEMAKNPAALAQVDTSSVDRLLQSLSTVVNAAAFSSNDRQKLVALVQSQQGEATDEDDMGAPAATVYKTHSTGVVDVLEDLKEKAEEQLATLRKTEDSAAHNYAMLKQSLEDQMGADTESLGAEKAAKAAAEEKKASAEGDLAETEKVLADGKAALEAVHGDCMTTAADHEATVAARTEELGVIAKAKSLLESSSSGAVAQTYSMLQVAARSRIRTRRDLANNEVVTMIARLGKKQHSAALTQLASRIAAVMEYGASAGEDPFTKVKGLISQLITKLENEAATTASEKAYCDEQMSKTEAKKGELSYDTEKLSTKIDQAEATSAGLKEDVKELQAELASLAKLQADMDKNRAGSHADYTKAKEDLETGLSGVRSALGLLRDYYGSSAASAAAMLQAADAGEQPTVPEAHVKATGAGSSIIGILEVVESDFAKNLAIEEKEEGDAESEYEATTQSNTVTKTLKDQDVKYKTAEYKSLDKTVSELKADLETKDAELSAVLEYYEKVKERCIAKAETYEERKAKREAELAGLKEALDVLESETAFVQRKGRGRHSGRFLAAGDQ
jgi:chromosome segregation ATPase